MGTGVPGSPPATPRGRESLVVTSGDKAPYGDGEGRCLATARGRLGEGAGGGRGGLLLHPPRGFCMFGCSHLPGLTFSSGVSQVSQRPAAVRPLWSLCWGGASSSLWPQTRIGYHILGLGSRGRGQGGSSHFTLFREYEFTHKSRGWAPSWPLGPPDVETGSRSCTKWEWGGGWGPEQLSQGVAGRAFGWETASQESWRCRNLLKTLRLFFP